MILEVLDGPDIDGKQEVIATVKATADGFDVSGPRASEFLDQARTLRKSLAAQNGQYDRETLKLVGTLPSPEDTLRYWLTRFPKRSREAAS